MIKTYKILSLLLSYPNDELQKFLLEVEKELTEESLLPKDEITEIAKFCKRFNQLDLTDWQGEYVQLFDYSRSVSLHILNISKVIQEIADKRWSISLSFTKKKDCI